MSDAYIILDSEDEEEVEQQQKVKQTYNNESENEQASNTLDFESELENDDEPLFVKNTTRNSQLPTTKQSNQKRDSYSLYLDDLKASKSTPSPSPPLLSPSPTLAPTTTSYHTKKNDNKTKQHAKFLGESSSEEDNDDLPPLIKKTQPHQQRKRTLKNPVSRKREKSIDFIVDDDEEVEMEEDKERDKRENSLDLLLEKSHKIIESSMDLGESSLPSKGKRSLRNPIPKRKNSVDELLDRHTNSTSSSVNKAYDNKKKKTQDHFLSDDELDVETEKMSYEKKTTQKYLSDSDGDDMGTTSKSIPPRKQTQSRSGNSSGSSKNVSYKVDSINLLSDDSEKEEEEKEKPQVNRNNKHHQNKRNSSNSPPRKLKRSSLFHPKDKTDSFFFDDELDMTKQSRSLSRKNSVDELLESTSSLVVSRSPSPALPTLDTMTQRPRPRISMEKLVYGSDSSPENSPTLQPKKIKKKITKSNNSGKQRKTNEDDTNYDVDDFAEFEEHDHEIEKAISRLSTRHEKTKEQDPFDASGNRSKSNSPSNITISIDDSDDDNNDGGIESDTFFNELMSLPKKRNQETASSSTSKKQKVYNDRSLESVASSSKPITPMTSYCFDDDEDDNDVIMDQDEPVLTDRKGKKRAVEHGYSYDFNDRLSESNSQVDEDNLTPKEKRRLQSLKKKEEAQRKREEKQRQKEQQKLEKERAQLYEKANKIKNNRTEVVKEMIVDMHPSFLSTKTGQIIKDVFESSETQVETLNEEKYCHTMSWRRKCTAEWDVDSQSFIPLATTTLIDEPFVLIHFEWVPFIQHIVDNTLDELLQRVKKSCQDKQVLLMIEGLEVYYRKKALVESRKFQQAVRQSINNEEEDTSTATANSNTSKRKKTTSSVYLIDVGPSRMKVEELLVQLQMMDDIMLIPTKDDGDSASWLKSLTIDLALGRYKSKNLNNTYRVGKTGQGASDSFSKMLQEIHLCTPAIANSVMSVYPTAQSLYQAYKKTSRGDILLADLQVERSTVHSRDRTINNVMSKKIYTIFTSTDPENVIF